MSTADDALVSILIPTYNGERFLKAALRSALGQSYRNLEVLVGDDASTDGTAAIVDAAAAADPRVRVIRHETNVGAFGNPRRLFELARGKYVKYLLHDDVLATDCVRDLVRGLERTPGAALAFSKRIMIDENGRPIPGQETPTLADRPGALDGRELGNAILVNCSNVIGELTTVLFRREDVDIEWMWHLDGRQLDVLGDLVLHLRLLARGPAFYTPQPLSRFRWHPTQISQDSRFVARGIRDWPRLVDWGARSGFLADPVAHRRAMARALLIAVSRIDQLAADGDIGPALDAAHLATAGLAELSRGVPTDPRPLQERAHAAPLLDLFAQELDVWTTTYPVAVAAPRLDAPEIEATVRALREVLDAGATQELLVAVPEADADAAAALIDAALAQGPAIDVKVVPTDSPADLFRTEWLAVAPRGANWHEGRASAVFGFGAARSPLPA